MKYYSIMIFFNTMYLSSSLKMLYLSPIGEVNMSWIAHCDQNTSATVLKLMAQANTTGYMFLKHITGAWLPGAA